ncbi:hypothetical protein chiPu_0006734 [Chiloscyllium punctatum]|uniref:Uncharacterized protein n=1 Tax=Chiloscyllium punctatum TaxID=137246 RepID=A0A401SD36_CHIPU|nr:hypothetical protein [Chiloscyllium punctatum]
MASQSASRFCVWGRGGPLCCGNNRCCDNQWRRSGGGGCPAPEATQCGVAAGSEAESLAVTTATAKGWTVGPHAGDLGESVESSARLAANSFTVTFCVAAVRDSTVENGYMSHKCNTEVA